ncbi:MAG: flagellin FliC [Candidatus Hydrogenedentes bacterium]|nr:flagellin FliC [Candidatus Hydrogenedentota bacterium]
MGLQVNTNLPALNAGRQTRESNRLLTESLQKLSSGRRINRAADDAAGLAIAERFSSLVRQDQQEIGNLQSGISASQIAEGGLSAQQDAVARIRELAVQASNGTLNGDQRNALNQEAQQLLEQIGTTATDTQFNGQGLLDQNQSIDLGTEGGSELELQSSTLDSLGLNGVDLSTAEGAAAAIEAADGASEAINANRSTIGAQVNRFSSAIEQRNTSALNQLEAESNIRDLDIAQAILEKTTNEIRTRSGIAALNQARVTPQSALALLS